MLSAFFGGDFYSIRINDQWIIVFKWEDGNNSGLFSSYVSSIAIDNSDTVYRDFAAWTTSS